MNINWLKYDRKNHVLGWFLLHAITEKGVGEFTADGDFDGKNIDVKCFINGIEVSIEKTFNDLENMIDNVEQASFKRGFEDGCQVTKDRVHKNLDNIMFKLNNDEDDYNESSINLSE